MIGTMRCQKYSCYVANLQRPDFEYFSLMYGVAPNGVIYEEILLSHTCASNVLKGVQCTSHYYLINMHLHMVQTYNLFYPLEGPHKEYFTQSNVTNL